jgi:hypothetical protein
MNKKILILVGLIFSLFTFSCKEKMTEDEIASIGIAQCRIPAPYIKELGFDVNQSAYSTEMVHESKGIVLIQAPKFQGDTNIKRWQHPTWEKYGYMGSVTTDNNGYAYTAPIPFVNTLDYSPQTINQIFRIDNMTGEMKPYVILPKPDSVEGIVPYGVLGVFFDCHAEKLYAASVSGSTRDEEKGVIYVIDTKTAKIVDELKGLDACGVFVNGLTGVKKLFFGSARSSDIYSVELTKDGMFDGKPQVELSLDGMGPRGSDIARRIRADKYGNLNIYGVEFNFSLAAQSNKPETFYQFLYNSETKKWSLIKTE